MAIGSPQWMYASGEDFTLDQSLRFNDNDSAYLSRTFASAGNRRTFTLSMWFKLGNLGVAQKLWTVGADSSNKTEIEIGSSGIIWVEDKASGSAQATFQSTQLLRDTSAWYHLIVAVDTTQGTAANRVKIYLNGNQVTDFTTYETYPDQNDDWSTNTAAAHYLGKRSYSSNYYDGYLGEVNFIDGAAKVPADFGETGDYGEWKPIEYEGSYGTNGFYLPFKQDYTVEGFSTVTYKGNDGQQYIGGVGFSPDLVWFKARNATYSHELFDTVRGNTKRLVSNTTAAEDTRTTAITFDSDGFTVGTGGDASTNDPYNYVAWNWDMGNSYGTPVTITANGAVAHSTDAYKFGASSIEIGGGSNYLSLPDEDKYDFQGDFTVECWVRRNGNQANNGSIISKYEVGGWILTTDVNEKILWWDQATGTQTKLESTTVLSDTTWYHIAVVRKNDGFYLFINGTLEDSVATDYNYSISGMNTALLIGRYSSGNAGAFVGHLDDIRISNKARYDSNFTAPTTTFTNDANTILLIHSDTSDGSTTFTDSSGAAVNTSGTITSNVSANPTYGQSIVSYTGTGANATIGHGLSGAHEMIIVKNRDTAGEAWNVYHTGLGDNDKFLELSDSAAVQSNDNRWNDTAPTSSVFSVGVAGVTNESTKNIIAYCFDSVAGYSKFGSYTANDSTTNVITTGFKPAFVMIKCSSDGSGDRDWAIFDSARSPTNTRSLHLDANDSLVENHDSRIPLIDFNDTNFTLKSSHGETNGGSETYIYAAFADKREYAYWLDNSGNNNDWTSNNLTESDIMVDSPTNNFCTMNPLDLNTLTLSEGNLKISNGADAWYAGAGTYGVSTGKWYWEVCATSKASGEEFMVGIKTDTEFDYTSSHSESETWLYYADNGNKYTEGSSASYGSTYDVGDTIGVALDLDSSPNSLTFYKNNSSQGTADTSMESSTTVFMPLISIHGNGTSMIANFGQDSSFAGTKTAQGNQDSGGIGDFYYTPPTDFLALCTSNLPAVAVTPSEHFNTVLYSGNSSTNAITGVGFQPDFTWFKARSDIRSHSLVDSVRGFNGSSARVIQSASTNAEWESAYINSLNSDGFTVSGSENYINNSSHTYVSWNWKANGSGSANTTGSINSTVSANTDAGFSIVAYTGNGSTGTVGHGLSKAPEMVIFKSRDSGARNWSVYNSHTSTSPNDDVTFLNLTNATASGETTYWNNTNPTANLFSVGDTDNNTNDEDIIAYCFHSVDGYSKVGSYLSNNSTDGPFVYLGFQPKFVLCKGASFASDWTITDNERELGNPFAEEILFANDTLAETTYTGGGVDFTSNGFKVRSTGTDGTHNANSSGLTFIYLAFAETPFKYSNAR